ncbi:hypothetical protein C8F01DRAFT_1232389 [Mycena amicta]|nr:hypothetical protein C8F01DRAFT_1232389 [Mycena amicta]
MHPSLRLSNLRGLPANQKKLATIVASAQRTATHINALSLAADSLDGTTGPLLLPVIYAVLDEDPSALDQLVERADVGRLAARLDELVDIFDFSRKLLSKFDVDNTVLVELWPRIWHWAQYADHLCEQMPSIFPRASLYTASLLLFATMLFPGEELPYDKLPAPFYDVVKTPGFLTLISRAWTYFLRQEGRIMDLLRDDGDVSGLEVVLRGLGVFSTAAMMEKSAWFQPTNELEGLWGELAALTVDTLAHLFPDAKPCGDQTVELTRSLTSFVRNLRNCSSFQDALNNLRIAQRLTTCCRALIASSVPSAKKVFSRAFNRLLVSFAKAGFGSGGPVVDALDAGFFLLLSAHISDVAGEESSRVDFLRILEECMPVATISLSVLTKLEAMLPALDTVDTSKFFHVDLIEPWRRFLRLVHERVNFRHGYKSFGLAALRACSNPQCTVIARKDELRRCGGCLVAHYCSRACQRVDYRTKDHKRLCETLYAQKHFELMFFVREDLVFIHALMTNEYAKRKYEVAMRTVRFWHITAGKKATPVVVFDFSRGACRVSVIGLAFALKRYTQAMLSLTQLSRSLEESGGKAWIHLFVTYSSEEKAGMDGPSPVPGLPRPMRCSNSMLWDGLKEIAAGLPAYVRGVMLKDEDCREDVLRLLQQCVRVRESY